MLYIYFDNITFADIVKGLVECLTQLGIKVETTNKIKDDNFLDLYIIFGMNDFTSQVVPNNYIVYQLEQTTGNDESKWFSQRYINYMKNAIEVWDYSLVNYQNLKKLGINKLRYFPLQYMRCVDENHSHDLTKKDIDVLFYGSMNDRRQQIIDQLTAKGMNIVVKTNIWEKERFELISRSKVIINIHYYEQNILESARISYLLSNQCAVLSETSRDPLLDKWHVSYLKIVAYDQLISVCV